MTLILLAVPQGVGAQDADMYVGFYLGLSRPLDSDFTVRDSGAGTGALAGVKLFFTPHLAFFAEYKYSRASHSLQLFDVSEKFVLEVNHFAGGFACHF